MATEIKGMDELIANIKKLEGIKTNAAMLAGAMELQRWSQENAPVKTGFLRSSAESNETDKGAELSFSAEYSLFQEMGTSKMPGKFYVTRALDEHKEDILNAVKNQITKEMGG